MSGEDDTEVDDGVGGHRVVVVIAGRGSGDGHAVMRDDLVARRDRRVAHRRLVAIEQARVEQCWSAEQGQQQRQRYGSQPRHLSMITQRGRATVHAGASRGAVPGRAGARAWPTRPDRTSKPNQFDSIRDSAIIRCMSSGQSGLRGLVLCALILLVVGLPAQAQIAVAAASDLQPVLPEIVARFGRAVGEPPRVSFGSSGNFVAQIQNGAPFDVFLSADETYVTQLVSSGHADGSTAAVYASGRLALWSRSDKGLILSAGLTSLTDGRIKRIAIANPVHAPYGRAAVDALRGAGLYDRLKDRLVLGENVAQAAQFAQTGNADVALIALSLTLTPAMQRVGTAVEVPASAFSPIRQTAVVLTRSAQADLARRFVQFLGQPDIALLLRRSGFGPRP